ncbi:MAG: hypothetical protein ACRD11_14535 [Terriglobia bacterium]
MTRFVLITLLLCPLALAQKPAVDPVAVARSFLPPHTQLGTLYTFDYRTLSYGPDYPAVLTGHIVSPSSNDIVFAYYSPRPNVMPKTLFVTLLHPNAGVYQKIYELSYRPQILLVSNAIRIVHLRNVPTDGVAVIAGIGAALGGHLQVFVWRDPWGWQNIFPPNGGMHYFYFFPKPAGLEVALTYVNHPGLNVSPPPFWYRWNGKRFVKIPPPKGSSKWRLPD